MFKRLRKVFERFSFLKSKKKTDIKSVFDGDEIVLKEVLNILVERKLRFILLSVLGVVLAIASISLRDPVFESQTVIVSEVSGQNVRGRRLGGLASLAGVNLPGQSQSGLTSPNFYPDIVKSELFLTSLMEERFFFRTFKKNMSLMEFYVNYEEKDRVTMWVNSLKQGKLPKFKDEFIKSTKKGYGQQKYKEDKNKNVIKLTSQQSKAIRKLNKAINVERDEETGLITVSVRIPEKIIAARLVDIVMKRMIDFAVRHQVRKEQINLRFVKRREKRAKQNWELAQTSYADFLDQNQNVISARVKAKEEQFKTELQIKTKVYSQLSQQLEEAELAVKEKTPVYSVFRPAVIPLQPIEENNTLIILSFALSAVVIALFSVIIETVIILSR